MKKNYYILILVFFGVVPILVPAQSKAENPQAFQILSKTKSYFFIENKGQWPSEVRYLARIGGMNAWITNSGVVYDYYKIIRDYQPEQTIDLPPNEKDEFERKHTRIKGQVINMVLESANIEAKSLPSGKHEGYFNYFIGNDTSKWESFVSLYSEVFLQDIYPGIDIHYYFENGLIRYDYIAKPGADIAQINFKINGSGNYGINENGELTLKTNLGKITHGKLFAYQNDGNKKTKIGCSFIKTRNGLISVFAENYNPALALVIDPLIYSTFIGGSESDAGYAIANDGSGNAIVAGTTSSVNYPATTGAYDISQNTNYDGFVTKLNSSGSSLIYSTFIGGNSEDRFNSMVVDGYGNTFMTGYTSSTNYPTSTGAFETSYNGGLDDAFVTSLNATGSDLLYSTFIGGDNSDEGNSIAIDANGNTFITGYTQSTNYPTTSGAYDVSHSKGMDVFVTKLNSLGSSQIYSTFIGDSNDERGTSISIDSSGNAFITGYTGSKNYPTTPGAYDTIYKGKGDAFVTKLNYSGTALIYSTFIGGTDIDYSFAIAIDGIGNAFITGKTTSSDYPTTTGAFDMSHNMYDDINVTKLNSTGTALIYSTYIGGTGLDAGYSIALDSNGYAYITGFTSSNNYPTTKDAYDLKFNGSEDVILTILNPAGSALAYSTFIGGTSGNAGISIAVDNSGDVFVTGNTISNNYPTTTGAFDVSYNGGFYDGFVTKYLFIRQATNIKFSNITSSDATCTWTKGSGTKRAVFVKQTNTGIGSPINNSSYIAYDFFGMGSQIGSTGWYCVYNDTGSSVIIKGLLSNTTYRTMVFEYKGKAGYENYTKDSVTNNPLSFTTIYSMPSIQASDLTFINIDWNNFSVSCTNGDGSKRVVFVKKGNSGNPIPVNNITYTANTDFGSGTQIGNSGWYCVYNDTGNTVTINNLLPNTIYRVMVCEYNGTSGKELYLINSVASNPENQITDYTLPGTQAHNLILSRISNTSISAKWINGNGLTRVVFIKSGNSGNAIPSKYTSYIADNLFGHGSQIGNTGWYCVYNGTNNSVIISGLTPDSIYRIMVCEYNGSSGRENYNIYNANNNPLNYYPIHYVQAESISFSNHTQNSITASWSNGNGSSRIVFVREGNYGVALPVDNTLYIANNSFSLGSQIGITGWYSVYDGKDSSINIINLKTNTSYIVMVCEYNGVANNEQYNTDTAYNNPNTFSLVSINQLRQKQYILYPNPFSQSTIISFPNTGKRPYTLYIFDLSGKMVRIVQNIKESQVVVTKNDLSAGLYYFELVGNEIFRGRFVVE